MGSSVLHQAYPPLLRLVTLAGYTWINEDLSMCGVRRLNKLHMQMEDLNSKCFNVNPMSKFNFSKSLNF